MEGSLYPCGFHNRNAQPDVVELKIRRRSQKKADLTIGRIFADFAAYHTKTLPVSTIGCLSLSI
ncbi:MAG: hypothetical protein CV087_20010 [Candidatus Brocadia sp. WS118]|nr:MAG: hypothetical protein CV087_20010 [Candidatus Brocadia sp. WS118]